MPILKTDCIDYLRMVDIHNEFDFCFADPPFNIGHHYDGFDDVYTDAQYADFTINWIDACWQRLSDGAAFVIHASIKLRPVLWRALIELSIDSHFETEIAWHFRFGVNNRHGFVDGHCPEIVLRKPGERRWYPDAILVDSDRKAVYNDKRVGDYENGGSKVPQTVWGVPSDGKYWGRVSGNSKERRPHHPNQLPTRLLQRHVRAYTKKGDRVLDPFCGSGTTALVCHHEGRDFVTMDLSQSNVDSAKDRLDNGFYRS